MQAQVPMKRTVIVRFPDGGHRYWQTDRSFSEGDTLGDNGRRWIVTEVTLPAFTQTHLTVRVREAE